ncbi:MAG: DMT family transporter [Promicromonosporaceae bacterium]|nr:DMT family transporter [Promicromonosporaceae bacterium]
MTLSLIETQAPERAHETVNVVEPVGAHPPSVDKSRRENRIKIACIAATFGAGLVSAVQSRVNGSFGAALGNSFLSALVNFASALAILTLLLILSPKGRAGLTRVIASLKAGVARHRNPFAVVSHPGVKGIGHLRWFQIIGGAAGALFVTAQGMSVPALGVALFVVAVTAGQTVSSLFVDRLGFAPGGKRKITLARTAGPLVIIAAVLVSQWPNISARVNGEVGVQGIYILLPVIAGIFVAAQHAANGRIETTATVVPRPNGEAARHEFGAGVLTATFINFLVGTIALVVVAGISLAIQGAPTAGGNLEWWMLTGGALGVIFIGTSAGVMHRIGALLVMLSLVAGQTVGGLLLDLSPWGGTMVPPVTTYIGVVLVLIAIAIPAFKTKSA